MRLSYGAGGAVYAIKEAAYTMFVLLFYTQVLGLNGTAAAVVIRFWKPASSRWGWVIWGFSGHQKRW
jgi:Na+/melibiose symporter-like transporter